MHDNTHDPLVGQMIEGKYRLERLIGQGGMGAVYRATHVGTDRPVALKIIAPELVGDAVHIERFQREARAAGRLRHPNVVDVTDFGVARGATHDVAYLVMEYLEGETLAAFLRKKPMLPLETIVEIVSQVCAAMNAAHNAGIVHRDLKPENVWLASPGEGRLHAKVLDFGIAKLRERDAPRPATPPPENVEQSAESNTLAFAPTLPTPAFAARGSVMLAATPDPTAAFSPAAADVALTEDGAFLGTPLYMSPEQCAGLPLDARSDIYSLGVITYEMLAGAPPFVAASPLALLSAHIGDTPPPLAERRPDIPPAVASLVMATLEKDPDKRPASCARLAAALEARTEGLGALLRHAVAIYLGHFRALLVLSWPVVLANMLLFLYQLGRVLMTRVFHVDGFERVAPLAGTPLAVALSFGIAIALALNADYVFRAVHVKGRAASPPTLRILLRRSLPIFWPNLAAYACQMLAQLMLTYAGLFGYLAVDGLRRAPAATLASLLPPPDWVTHFRFGYGFLLFNGLVASILGTLLIRRWSFVALVAWFEGTRFKETMRRSSFLASRDLGTLSAALPIYSLLIYGPLTAANIIVAFVSGWPAEITLAEGYSEGYSGPQIALIGLIIIPLISPLAGTLLAVVYRHLLRWEGDDQQLPIGPSSGKPEKS